MAGAIDRIFGRSFTFLNSKESLSGKRADRLAERFDRAEENLERKEQKILERMARIEGVREDKIKDKDDKDKKDKKIKEKDAALTAIEERLEERLADIQQKKDNLALVRAQVFGEDENDDDQDDGTTTNTVVDDLDDDDAVQIDFGKDDDVTITPVENPVIINENGQYQFTKGDLRHGQLKLRELETASIRVKSDGEYLNRSEELIDKQIEAAEDVQYELRKGRDPDRLRKKQEVLFSVMEEKYLLDEALRKRKGQESEEFEADPEIFHTVPKNIEFIKEKEEEKRNVASLQETVARQETSLFKEIDAAKAEISKIARFQIDKMPTLDNTAGDAEKTANTLQTNIPLYPDQAEDAHYGLNEESGKLLVDEE